MLHALHDENAGQTRFEGTVRSILLYEHTVDITTYYVCSYDWWQIDENSDGFRKFKSCHRSTFQQPKGRSSSKGTQRLDDTNASTADFYLPRHNAYAFMEEQEFSGILSPNACDPVTGFHCIVSTSRLERKITYVADILPDNGSCKYNIKSWDRNDSILSQYWSPEDGIGGHDTDPQSLQLTYGEVTPLGVRQLAQEMGITDCDNRDHQADGSDESDIVFYDLGSGVGRLVTQMYFDQPDRVTKAVGIELAEDRHRIGEMALEGIIAEEEYMIENFYSPYDDKDVDTSTFSIQLIHGNVLDVDLDPKTTHVYISSLCFPKNVLEQLQKKLLRLPNIRVVAALNRLDLIRKLGGEQWEEERDVFIQMSWGDAMAKIYRKIV